MIASFPDLLTAARQQAQPQRLLFLFARAEASGQTEQGTRGNLEPVMCVDRLPEEIASFDDFVEEADSIAQDWDFMFAVGLSGNQGIAPTPEEAEPYLNKMTNDLVSGHNIQMYVVFNRDGDLVQIQAG